MKKFLSPILAATMLAGIALSGCNTMDKYFSEDYVLGALDASYKGDFDKYLDTTDGKKKTHRSFMIIQLIITLK